MPFTFSHPALILPFYSLGRKYLSLTGLIIGSIVPDFGYFILLRKASTHFSHSKASLLYFNLPLGLLLAFLFHEVVRRPLLHNLPAYLYRRFGGYDDFCWRAYFRKHWPAVAAGILVGAASHLAWDRFTHACANYVYQHQQSLMILQKPFSIFRVYMGVHLVHSLIGLLVLALAFFRLPAAAAAPSRGTDVWYWPGVVFFAGALMAAWLLGTAKIHKYDLVVTAIAASLCAVLFASLVFKGRLR